MVNEAQVQVDDKTRSDSGLTKDSEIALTVKSLQEETLQISELSEMEVSYADEVVVFFKQLLERLNISFHIKPTSIAKTDSSLNDVVLSPQGIVCLLHSNGTVNTKSLEALQTETLVKVLIEIVPQIKLLLSERRQKMNARVNMLEKLAWELRKIPPIVTAKGKPSTERRQGQQARSSSGGDQSEEKKSASSESHDAVKAAF